MEFPFRGAIISTIAHATEDDQRVLRAIRTLLPKEVEVRPSKLKGHYGNPIVSFETRVEPRRFLREFWLNLVEKLRAGELEKLEKIASERIDEDCYFYLRFDKQLAYDGELALTESGDAIHLKLKVAAYPAKREMAIGLVKQLMKERTKLR